MAMTNSQQYPLHLYQIINVEDTVIFLNPKVYMMQWKSKNHFYKETKI